MKRKLILLIPVLFLVLNLAGAKVIEVPEAVGGVTFLGGGTPASSTTDYAQDANAMAVWFMNGAASGSETDRSGEGETLTNTNSVTSSITVPSGYAGNSRGFQSADSDDLYHADGGSTDISGAEQALSMVGWFYFTTINADQTLISKWGSAGTDYQYQLLYDTSSDELRCQFTGDGSTVVNSLSASGISATTWVHIACVEDPSDNEIRIYINGSLDSNGVDNPKSYSSGIYAGAETFYLGRRFGYTRYFNGLMDEVGIFNRVLTQTEIDDIKTDGIDGTKGGND